MWLHKKAIDIVPENKEEVVVKRPVIIHNNIAKEQKEPPVDINKVTADVPDDLSSKQIDVAALQTPEINTTEQNNNRVYTVAYKEINTNDDDRSLHVGMLDLNKDKVRTLFKKAGRMFGSKPNDPTDKDGKLQVANFEIDTKNNN